MALNSSNSKKSSGHGKRNALIAAIVSVAAVILMILAFFLSKNTIFYLAAKFSAINGDFAYAGEMIEKSNHKNAEVLEKYINLRAEINRDYPVLLSEYDREKIKGWSDAAKSICGESEILGKDISYEAEKLSLTLNGIVECEEEYAVLQADILEMMDVFNEINRLHTKDGNGKNISFTILEERNKLNGWTHLSDRVLSYVSRVPGNENIYLINYMVKEAQGEISEISDAIDRVAGSGYAETDLVRFSGDAEKKFPDITNSNGESVNLLEKEKYEKFMYNEICRELVSELAVFYVTE